MYIVFGNYGNQTLALIQWLISAQLADVTVVSVDTGWADETWLKHVVQVENYARQQGFKVERLRAEPNFADLMRERGQFPSQKFQWCASFLKGLPFIEWLDKVDPRNETCILLGKRRLDSRANIDLPERISKSEHYGEREVWHPLFDCPDEKFIKLIAATGFSLLSHRSLECDPCVNSRDDDFLRLCATTVAKTEKLEHELGKNLFSKPISDMVKNAKPCAANSTDKFNMGCGSPFVCGE